MLQRAARDDEGPVRELRGAEDDRRSRADAAQGADAQDPAAHRVAAQVHLRQAHNRQAGEVLHEDARAGPNRAAAAQPRVVVRTRTRTPSINVRGDAPAQLASRLIVKNNCKHFVNYETAAPRRAARRSVSSGASRRLVKSLD